MSALQDDAETESSKAQPGSKVQRFRQPVPMPTYLIAIAVGHLESRQIGPRSRVWSEKELVDLAAFEFDQVCRHFLSLIFKAFAPLHTGLKLFLISDWNVLANCWGSLWALCLGSVWLACIAFFIPLWWNGKPMHYFCYPNFTGKYF